MAKDTAAASPSVDDGWRGESDYNSLQRACEIMADKIRMKGVLRHQSKQRAVDAKMSTILARHRSRKS